MLWLVEDRIFNDLSWEFMIQEQADKTTWVIDPVHTKIRFDTKYLMLTTVSGWFREVEGTVQAANSNFNDCSINLTIYTNSVYTGIDERDEHLRSSDFFDAKKYPTINFHSTNVEVNGDLINIKGILSVKDITQEITFRAKHLGTVPDPFGNLKAGFEMDMVFDRQDFHISWNQLFDENGILISDQVKLHADIQLLKF